LRDLIQTLKSSNDASLVVTDLKEVEKLKARFEKLLGIENIGLLSKAMRLQRDGERLFCDAKTLSDIRPVFHDDASSAPAGGVITHTLKLGYREGGEHKEFFIVLGGSGKPQRDCGQGTVKRGYLAEAASRRRASRHECIVMANPNTNMCGKRFFRWGRSASYTALTSSDHSGK
jgi:hypothetical protein